MPIIRLNKIPIVFLSQNAMLIIKEELTVLFLENDSLNQDIKNFLSELKYSGTSANYVLFDIAHYFEKINSLAEFIKLLIDVLPILKKDPEFKEMIAFNAFIREIVEYYFRMINQPELHA